MIKYLNKDSMQEERIKQHRCKMTNIGLKDHLKDSRQIHRYCFLRIRSAEKVLRIGSMGAVDRNLAAILQIHRGMKL